MLFVIAAVITFFAALIQGTIGFGAAALAVPLLTLLDPAFTPIPQIMLGLVLSAGMAIREHSSIDFRGVRWVLVGRLVGAFLGAWLLGMMTEQTGSIVIGVVVLGAVILLATGWTIPRNKETEVAVGVFSGTSGIVAGVGGPPLALLFAGTEGPTTRSTLSTIFVVGQSINVVVLTATGRTTMLDLRIALLLALPLVLGFVLSSRLHPVASGRRLRVGILTASGLAAAMLLIQSL